MDCPEFIGPPEVGIALGCGTDGGTAGSMIVKPETGPPRAIRLKVPS
jgi:hypothetical protein